MAAMLQVGWASYQQGGMPPWRNDQDLARRLKLWGDVPLDQRPAFYQFEGEVEDWKWTNKIIPIVTIPVKLFAYINAKDPSVIGATQLNQIIEALKNAFTPTGMDAALGRFTLGNRVNAVRIKKVFKDPGDLDGDGMMMMTVEIELPAN